MDAFFASVEQLDDPTLRGRPVVVGGSVRRGVVAAASYEVRKFGVRSAMPMAEAMRRCPEAVIVTPRMARYSEVSARVFAIFRRFTPLVEGLSVDEAFLDVTASRSLFGEGEVIARRIKDAVREEIGLTASAGVAPSKFVAKIASDLQKPDGLVVVREGEVREFLAPLPVERMWGVGPRASDTLRAAGFRTIGDLAASTPAVLERFLGSWGAHVHELANGIDERPVVVDGEAKSIGAEETFDVDVHTTRELEKHLLAQSARVAERLQHERLSGSVVVVKVKYRDFQVRTRQKALPEPVDDTDSIYEVARELLGRFPDVRRGVRLTGVSVAHLSSGPPPKTLFPDERRARRHKLEATVTELRARLGNPLLTRASLLDEDD